MTDVDGEAMFELVQNTLGGSGVALTRVGRGQFLAKWHRERGVLTEETPFTLVERAFVAGWA